MESNLETLKGNNLAAAVADVNGVRKRTELVEFNNFYKLHSSERICSVLWKSFVDWIEFNLGSEKVSNVLICMFIQFKIIRGVARQTLKNFSKSCSQDRLLEVKLNINLS